MSSAVLYKVKLPTLCVISFFSLTDLEYIDWNCVSFTHIYHFYLLLKWVKQARKVGGHVFLCKGYWFCLFLLFYWILELFWQCGIFYFSFFKYNIYIFVYVFLVIFVLTLIMTFSGDLTRNMSIKPLDQIVCPVFLFLASYYHS